MKKQEGYEWVKIRERNEVLDTRNYACAIAALLGYDRMKEEHFRKLEEQFSTPASIAKKVNAQKVQKIRRESENDSYWKD